MNRKASRGAGQKLQQLRRGFLDFQPFELTEAHRAELLMLLERQPEASPAMASAAVQQLRAEIENYRGWREWALGQQTPSELRAELEALRDQALAMWERLGALSTRAKFLIGEEAATKSDRGWGGRGMDAMSELHMLANDAALKVAQTVRRGNVAKTGSHASLAQAVAHVVKPLGLEPSEGGDFLRICKVVWAACGGIGSNPRDGIKAFRAGNENN